MFVAKDGSINKADMQYLEHKAIDRATESAQYGIMNEQSGRENSLSDYQMDIMEEFFDDVQLLSSFIGCHIFEKPEKSSFVKESLFHIKLRGCKANAIFNENDHSMRVLKGSLLSQSTVPSYKDAEKRNAIIKALSKPTKDGFWELQRDYVFISPSTEAAYCCGRGCNGWDTWKNEEGHSLDEIYRSKDV